MYPPNSASCARQFFRFPLTSCLPSSLCVYCGNTLRGRISLRTVHAPVPPWGHVSEAERSHQPSSSSSSSSLAGRCWVFFSSWFTMRSRRLRKVMGMVTCHATSCRFDEEEKITVITLALPERQPQKWAHLYSTMHSVNRGKPRRNFQSVKSRKFSQNQNKV